MGSDAKKDLDDTLKKHSSRRQHSFLCKVGGFGRKHMLWVFFGSMAISFTVFVVVFFPVINSKSGLELIRDFMSGDVERVEVKPLGDEPDDNWWIYPEKQSGQVFVAPQINWLKCKPWLSDHIKIFLEGKLNSSEDWIQNNEYLTVNLDDIGNNTLKSTWIFDAPITGDYRITVIADASTFNVSKTDDYEYTLGLEAFNQTFNLVFNYFDLMQYSGLQFKQGRTIYNDRDVFYFRVRRDNIPKDTHVELDPVYTVYSGTDVYTAYPSSRKLVRLSNGTIYCAFHEDSDIHIAYSEDDGATWVDREIWGAQTSARGTLVVDSNDVVHLVFVGYKNDVNDYQLEYTNSTDWDSIVQIRDEDKDHTYPSLAIDSNDSLHLVYEKGQEGASGDDQVGYINSTDNGGSWGTEQILTDEGGNNDDVWTPSIAIDSNDNLHVVYSCEDYDNGQDAILYITSADNGATWSTWDSNQISTRLALGHTFPSVACDDEDNLHVVWRDYKVGDPIAISYAKKSGGTWSDQSTIVNLSEPQGAPDISVADNNDLHVVSDNGTVSIHHEYYDGGWNFGEDCLLGGYANVIQIGSISTQYPIISGDKTNRPKTGYMFITTNDDLTNITFFASDDLTWDAPIAPVQSGESPGNGSIDIAVTPSLYVVCTDDNADSMNATWSSNSSGSWIDFATNSSITSGTNITQTNSNFSSGSEKYWWSVNLSDGTGYWDNETYHFSTSLNTPEIQVITPQNGSTGVSTTPTVQCKFWDNGTYAEMFTVEWYENTSGEYNFTLKGTQDDDGDYYGVWGDGTYIYAACDTYGIRVYTFNENATGEFWLKDTQFDGNAYRGVWGDGTYVYAACYDGGIRAYTFNENATGEFWLKDTQFDGGNYYGVWDDGTYVYVACGTSGIRAYTFNENATEEFWLKDTQDEGDLATYRGVWGDGTYVYASCDTSGIRAYTFNENATEEFWLKDTLDNGGNYYDAWGDGTYVYAICGNSGIRAYTFDGSSFTLKDTLDNGGFYRSVWGDGTYVYAACDTSGIRAYTFDGSDFTLKDTQADGGNYYDAWGDGTYVYAACYGDGIRAYTFDAYILQQTNTSVNNGGSVEWVYNNASSASTKYWWRVEVNNTQKTNVSTNMFTTASGVNNAPTITGEQPSNGSTNQSLQIAVGCTVNDADGGDTLTVTFATSPDGSSWTNKQTNGSISPGGTVNYTYSGASSYSTKYYWKVYADDGTDNTTGATWDFTTKAEPEVTWQVVDDTFNGVFVNSTVWVVVDDVMNGVFTNTTVWKILDDAMNGVFTNLTLWTVMDDSIDGVFTNTTAWFVEDDSINGVFSNTTQWEVQDDTINGVFTNLTEWIVMDDNINGVFTNITLWTVLDDTINGLFTNITVWKIMDDTINGVFANTTVWKIEDDTYNGIFTNTTTWQVIDDTFNGLFTNTTVWHVVDNAFNGSFTNTSISLNWQVVDNTYNGVFTNATTWQVIDDNINGVFTNTTIWKVLDDSINGVFTNITLWTVMDDAINGLFTNMTTWKILSDTINGTFTNTTIPGIWHIVDNTYNGIFSNTTTWHVEDDTYNGVFTNASIWYVQDDSINGVFTNITLWTVLDDTINGLFINTTTWRVIDDDINGTFTNTTIPSEWTIVDNTVNGVFTNSTTWKIIDNSYNGVFSNTTIWRIITDTYNGIFTNTTSWQIVDDSINGEFTNTTLKTWQIVNNTFNGVFINSTTWKILNDTYNGVFTNITLWTVLDDTYNGVFTNLTLWTVMDDAINGLFTNSTVWKIVDNTINGVFTNTSAPEIWQIIDNTYNGIFTNITIWTVMDDIINGVFTNATVWRILDNTINGVFTNTSAPVVITITSAYPGNSSRNIPVQPVCYATFNSTLGYSMNVSWYFGTSLGAENTLLGTDTNIINSTQNELFYPACNRSTEYFWKLVVNDGRGNWLNETFSFTTAGVGGGSDTRSMGLIAAALMFALFGVVVGIYAISDKKKNNGRKH